MPVNQLISRSGSPALSVLAFQASSVLFILAALRFCRRAGRARNPMMPALTALASWSSEPETPEGRSRLQIGSPLGDAADGSGVINDDIDARLKELDELCRPLLMLDTPDVTWTLESFVAWAEPLIARPDAVSALTTEIIDMSIRTAA
jgi:hypothetical protein